MIVNEYVFREFPGSNTDITRIGAQVISGIGFLGVGTIMITGRNEVKGLTTAAGLWACAGIEMCIRDRNCTDTFSGEESIARTDDRCYRGKK